MPLTPLPPSSLPPHESLPRVLGPFDAVTIVVGGVIGSGIFLKPATVASELPYFGPILGVWIILGLITFCGALSLAELAAMLPHAGGPYVYLREAYGRLPAFLWGWTEFWIIRTGSVGALATATVIYFSQIVPLARFTQAALAAAIVIVLSIVNILSTRWAAWIQNVTAVVKVGFLLLIVVLPLALGAGRTENLSPLWPESLSASLWRALGVVMIAVLWPYDGWLNIAPIAEEIRHPQRNVPLALAVGMLTVIVVYALANIGYHLVLPMSQVAASKAVAASVFQTLLGDVGGTIVAAGVMVSTFGATNSNLLTGPRIFFAMARDGLLPPAVRHLHSTRRTPVGAILLQGAWTLVLIAGAFAWKHEDPGEAFDVLTDFVIFGGAIFYALAVGAVVVLRFKHPEWKRPYRTFGYPLTPGIFLLAYLGVMISLLREKRLPSLSGLLLIAAGAGFFLWARRRAARPLAPPSHHDASRPADDPPP